MEDLLLIIIDLFLLADKVEEYLIFVQFLKSMHQVVLVLLEIIINVDVIIVKLLSFLLTSC